MLSQALSRLKVVDFTQIAAGPTCTMMLADLGADVIKVEAPAGELGRAFFPYVEGESVTFMAMNRNKRSIALDLKSPEDLRVARELIASADVVVESFRPGVMKRLSLGYDEISLINPRVIYCSVSAYGQTGPWKDKPGVDGVIQAVSGLMSVTGSEGAPPCKVQVPVVDIVTGYLASISVLAAISQRDRENVGQHLDVSMFASAVALQQTAFATYFADGIVPERIGSAAPYAAPNEALRCSDGWIMVAAYHPERWRALCESIGAPVLAEDPRFSDSASRIANRQALVEALENRMRECPKHHWLEKFQAVDIICGPINDYSEVVSSPPFRHAEMGERISHPVAGDVTVPRFSLAAAGEVPATRRPPPMLGEHGHEVLTGLGYSAEQVDSLLAQQRHRRLAKQD